MRKHIVWIIIASVLLIGGLVVCGIAFFVKGFDFRLLNSSNYVTNEFVIEEKFDNISIDGDTEDILFESSEDGKCRVIFFENEKDRHEAMVEKGTLLIYNKIRNRWNFGISMDTPKITVYLPDTMYGSLIIDSDTGDVSVPDSFMFENVDIKLDTGDINLQASAKGHINLKTDTGRISLQGLVSGDIAVSSGTGFTGIDNILCDGTLETEVNTGKSEISNVKCRNFTSSGDTGDLKLGNVVASGEFRIKRDTGDVSIDGCDAGSVYIETDTGDVKGKFISDKVFITDTDTGKVDVPDSMTGGRCEITTDTGDIKFETP